MAKGWETVTWQITPPKLGSHRWQKAKSFHWAYCGKCGLVSTKTWGQIKSCNNCHKAFGKLCDG